MAIDGVLAGRVAIVTGAGQGVGRGIAIAMTQAGATVAVVDVNAESATSTAEQLADHGSAGLAIECDVSVRDQVERAVARTVDELGGVDILVNNAHDLRDVMRPFVDTDEEHLLRHLQSGFFGTYHFLQASYPHLKVSRGKVVNIGSGAGVKGLPNLFSYAVTKEAIRVTTRVVAREWGADGIRVNTICPRAADTPANQRFLDSRSDAERALMLMATPLGREGTTAEVGAVAVFLVSDAASYVTGHTVMVDGGSNIDASR